MASINTKKLRTKSTVTSPVQTVARNLTTFEGAPAYSRTTKGDLFILGGSFMFGEKTFYEDADGRKQRFIGLVRAVAQEDPQWLFDFLVWLRREAGIRTASVVGAVEAAKALIGVQRVRGRGEPGWSRGVLNGVITRPDEPGEALAYWLGTYGRKIPSAIQRGIGDSAVRLYTQRNALKWDSDGKAVRMADVIELTSPSSSSPEQAVLFEYLLDSHRRVTEVPETLPMIRRAKELHALDVRAKAALINASDATAQLAAAGLTWEAVSSWGAFTARTWEALVPTMKLFALIRNLRNMQQAGVNQATVDLIAQRLADGEQVRRSGILPYQVLAAYLYADAAQWAGPLEMMLQHSCSNVPSLGGRTLVLVDTSSSMQDPMSGGGDEESGDGKSKGSVMQRVQAAALFAAILASKGEADLHGYATGVFAHKVNVGASVLRTTEALMRKVGSVGHGTETTEAVRATYKGHDRVVIFTDGQSFNSWRGNPGDQVPKHIPMYNFNLAGYRPAMMESSATRHELGGLSDKTFAMLRILEQGRTANWPWLQTAGTSGG